MASTAEETTLLIDGDIVAFIAASAVQHNFEDGFGFVYPFANRLEGEATLDNIMWSLETGLVATHLRVILTDPESNWRSAVDPTYKTNRTGPRPLLLGILKDYLREKYGATHWPSLEADDVLGILATEPQAYPGKRIVVGRDKDFKSIPGFHYTWKDNDASGKPIVRSISQWEADRFHLIQTLAGDRVDGYDGVPGIGMDRAAKIIDNPVRLVPQEGVKTRGVNKGEAVTRWMSEPTQDLWACIVSHYRKADLDEAYALRTARLARILRHDEYDREKQRLTLWTPDLLRAPPAT